VTTDDAEVADDSPESGQTKAAADSVDLGSGDQTGGEPKAVDEERLARKRERDEQRMLRRRAWCHEYFQEARDSKASLFCDNLTIRYEPRIIANANSSTWSHKVVARFGGKTKTLSLSNDDIKTAAKDIFVKECEEAIVELASLKWTQK